MSSPALNSADYNASSETLWHAKKYVDQTAHCHSDGGGATDHQLRGNLIHKSKETGGGEVNQAIILN